MTPRSSADKQREAETRCRRSSITETVQISSSEFRKAPKLKLCRKNMLLYLFYIRLSSVFISYFLTFGIIPESFVGSRSKHFVVFKEILKGKSRVLTVVWFLAADRYIIILYYIFIVE